MANDKGDYCATLHTETGYKCTLSGEHTQHVAQGLNNEVIYTWPVADKTVTGFVPCWNCKQPATHTLTRTGSETLKACGNCARIDRFSAEERGWTVTPNVADDALGTDKTPTAWKATMPGTIEPATTTLGKPVTDFQVKVWYASGSAETVSHIDFLAAASIYSEAQDNVRVVAAEVHCPGGCLAASFRREGKCPDQAMCERMGDKGGRCWACHPADRLDTAGERG